MYLLAKNKLSLAAFIIMLLLIFAAILAPVIAPYPEDVNSTHIEDMLLPPSGEHLMGTDELGRDVFSRAPLSVLALSISTALIAVGIALIIGVPLGAIAGTSGGWIDNLIMRITDIFLSFPSMLLAIALVALLGPGPPQRYYRHCNLLVAMVYPAGPRTGPSASKSGNSSRLLRQLAPAKARLSSSISFQTVLAR